MSYKCNICCKTFGRIYELERHKIKKIKCSPKNIDVKGSIIDSSTNPPIIVENPPITTNNTPKQYIDVINVNKCINCNKQFSRSDSYKRHILFRCKYFDEPIKRDNNVIDLLTQIKEQQMISEHRIDVLQQKHTAEIQELKNTILELKEQNTVSSPVINNNTHNTNNTNNTNNTINNTTNNIILKFDDLDAYKKLDKKDIQYIMDAQAEYLIQRSIEVTHCNKKYPELHNVYIPDKKMQYAVAFTGSKFEMKPADKVVKALIVSQQNNICDYLEMPDIKISERNREKFDDMAENFLKYEDSRSENNRDIYKNAISDIKILLYNNKEQGKKAEGKIKRKKLASTKQSDIKNKT